jgi:hypothetical protein
MGGLIDAGIWGVAWAMFAVAAGFSLTVAAIAFHRRPSDSDSDDGELSAAYNALAPTLDR